MDVGRRILGIDRISLAAGNRRAAAVLSGAYRLLRGSVEAAARVRHARARLAAAGCQGARTPVRRDHDRSPERRIPARDRSERGRGHRTLLQAGELWRRGEPSLQDSAMKSAWVFAALSAFAA